MAAKEPKTFVGPEDQKKINQFARLYDQERLLQAKIQQTKNVVLGLEDAELALMESDESSINVRVGEAFILSKSDAVGDLITSRLDSAKAELATTTAELDHIKANIAKLRTDLYATFGDNISLDMDE